MALFVVAAGALAVFVAYEARHSWLTRRVIRGLRGASRRACARPQILPQRAVRGLGADCDQRHRRRRRLPLPDHAVPAGRARHVRAAGGLAHAADGHHDGAGRGGVQPDTARRGARLPMLVAGVGLAVGGMLLSRLTATSALGPMVIAFIVFGIGGGVVNAPITYTASV